MSSAAERVRASMTLGHDVKLPNARLKQALEIALEALEICDCTTRQHCHFCEAIERMAATLEGKR